MNIWAVVVAAGTGSRFGSPKQYELLGDRRVLDWAVAGARVVAAVPIGRVVDPCCGEQAPFDFGRCCLEPRARRQEVS